MLSLNQWGLILYQSDITSIPCGMYLQGWAILTCSWKLLQIGQKTVTRTLTTVYHRDVDLKDVESFVRRG